jgi:hypothetical protein
MPNAWVDSAGGGPKRRIEPGDAVATTVLGVVVGHPEHVVGHDGLDKYRSGMPHCAAPAVWLALRRLSGRCAVAYAASWAVRPPLW